MFKKRSKIDVVPGNKYTDYSEQFKGDEKYATLRQVAIASTLPITGAVLGGMTLYNKVEQLQTISNVQVSEPVQQTIDAVMSQAPVMLPVVAQPTGFIADKSLEVLAAALDPVIQILVAISFPIASVIMVGACFFFMIGNTERAWTVIMNAGLGYILIQLSPLFLDILKSVGEAM